jgi:hypothetical protein
MKYKSKRALALWTAASLLAACADESPAENATLGGGAGAGAPPAAEWVAHFSGVGEQEANSVHAQPDGSVAVHSIFDGKTTLANASLPTARGDHIVKLHVDGTPAWVSGTHMPGGPLWGNVAHASDGSVYAFGHFEQSVTLEGTTLSAPRGAVYLARYDPSGALAWAIKVAEATSDSTFLLMASLAIDPGDDSVYLVGSVDGNAMVGTTAVGTGPADPRTFLTKFDADGGFLWAKPTLSGHGFAMDVSVLASGDVMTVGVFVGLVMSRHDAQGKEIWSDTVSQAEEIVPARMTAVDGGGVVVVGGFWADTTVGGKSLQTTADEAAFVAKIEEDGSCTWATALDCDYCPGQAVTSLGSRVFVAGTFDTLTLGGSTLVSARGDAFVAELDADGAPVSIRATESATTGWARAQAITSDGSSIYVSGAFATDGRNPVTIGSTQLFNPVATSGEDSGRDGFVWKFTP